MPYGINKKKMNPYLPGAGGAALHTAPTLYEYLTAIPVLVRSIFFLPSYPVLSFYSSTVRGKNSWVRIGQVNIDRFP